MNEYLKEISKYWIEKSYRTLEVAKYDFKGNYLEAVLDRLYYAAFYIVSAFITLEGERFKKHSGVKSFFFKKVIKGRLIEEKFGKVYNKLYYMREEVDYTPNPSFSKEEVKELLIETEAFIRKMESLIKTKLKNKENF